MQTYIIGNDPRELLQRDTDRLVAIDTETTGTEWEHGIIGVSLAWRGPEGDLRSCYLPRAENTQLSLFTRGETIDSAEIIKQICHEHRIVGHNWPFDYRMLMHWIKLPPVKRSYDTMHLAKSTGLRKSLSLLNLYSEIVGNPDPWMLQMKKKRKTLHTLEPETAAKYAAGKEGDAGMTLQLAEILLPQYVDIVGEELHQMDQEFSWLVMAMVERGVPYDHQWCASRKSRFQLEMMSIQRKYASLGVRNLGSTKQVSGYLFGTLGLMPIESTSTGKPSVKKEVLEKLAEKHPDIEGLMGIVRFNEYQKAISSWIDPILQMGAWDGRIHSQLNPFGTSTFRMSSASFNMQGVPLKARKNRAYGGFAGVFKDPDPDFELWQNDIAQAEVRNAAMVASEDGLAEALASEIDPYIAMAISTWDDEKRRQDAKAATLSSIYCTGAAAFAENNGIPIEVASEILSSFRSRFPNINRATSYWEDYAFKNGFVIGPIPNKMRRIYLDKDAPDLYKAYNNIVQNSVAGMMQVSMLGVEKELPGALILQIHDSIVTRLHKDQIKEGAVKKIADIIIASMPEWMLERTNPRIPIVVDSERFDLEPIRKS